MSGEPNLVSRCCEAPVREVTALSGSGLGLGYQCTKCWLHTVPIKQWNTLPPPGTFEASPRRLVADV